MLDNLKFTDLSKTGLTDISDMPRKGKITIKPYAKIPDHCYRRVEIAKNINWKGFVEFFIFGPKTMILSGFSFNLFVDNHFLTSTKQLYNLSKA